MKRSFYPRVIILDSPLTVFLVMAFLAMFFFLIWIGKKFEVPLVRMLMKILRIKEHTAAKLIILIVCAISYLFAYIIGRVVVTILPALV